MTGLILALTWEGHRVRMVGTAERPLWIAKDACLVLGLHDSSHIARDIPDDEKGVAQLATPGGPQPYVCVTEAGLYRLISRSRKPCAERFQRWLFGEVLPCIRRHGCYPAPAEPVALAIDLGDPLQLTSLALQLTRRVAELTPKASAFDRLSVASGDVNLQECGRLLNLGPNRFIWRLIEDGILFRDGDARAKPYAEHLDAGRFRVIVTEREGQAWPQTMVTPQGYTWLAGLYPAPRALVSAGGAA